MRIARPSILVAGVIAAGVIAAVLGVHSTVAEVSAQLPEGPNRDLVVRTCSKCHALSNLTSTVGRSRARWDQTIDDMVLVGLEISPQERALVLDYLATALARQ